MEHQRAFTALLTSGSISVPPGLLSASLLAHAFSWVCPPVLQCSLSSDLQDCSIAQGPGKSSCCCSLHLVPVDGDVSDTTSQPISLASQASQPRTLGGWELGYTQGPQGQLVQLLSWAQGEAARPGGTMPPTQVSPLLTRQQHSFVSPAGELETPQFWERLRDPPRGHTGLIPEHPTTTVISIRGSFPSAKHTCQGGPLLLVGQQRSPCGLQPVLSCRPGISAALQLHQGKASF